MADSIPTGHDAVINALLAWGRSGLIPNTKVVKSYHPPVQDPVTGVSVLVPATTYVTGDTTTSGGKNGDFIIPGLTYKGEAVTQKGLLNRNTTRTVNYYAVKDIEASPVPTGTAHLGQTFIVQGLGGSSGTLSGSAAGTNANYPVNTSGYVGTVLNQPDATVQTNIFVKTMARPDNPTIVAAGATGGYFNTSSALTSKIPVPDGSVASLSGSGTVNTGTGGTGTTLTGASYTTLGGTSALTGSGHSIDTLPHAPLAGSNVHDFNVNTDPGDMDTATAVNFTKKADVYYTAAQNNTTEAQYQDDIKNAFVETTADRMTRDYKFSHPMYTDNLADAKAMFSIPFNGVDKTSVDPLKGTEMNTGRAAIPARYELVPTKAPCAIPGVLNCYMERYDSVDTSEPNYQYQPPSIIMAYAPHSLKKEEFWVETFRGTGSTKVFNLTHTNILFKEALRVFVNEVEKSYLTDYTITQVSGVFKLTFPTAPANKSYIKIGYDPSIMYKIYNDFDIPSTGNVSGAGNYYLNIGRRF